MLLRHVWLKPLMQPPTKAESEAVAQAEASAPGEGLPSSVTEDKEVADWVKKQLEMKSQGLLPTSEKPALHTVALDKVATSPIPDDAATPSIEA